MYEIPVLHPLLVHFPVAYLILSGLGAGVWAATGRRLWRHVTTVLLAAGAVGALLALLTGEEMEERSEGIPVVKELVGTHETMGWLTLCIAGAALVALALGHFTHKLTRVTDASDARDPVVWRIAIAVLCLAAAVTVAYTGHLGGTMSWGEAVD